MEPESRPDFAQLVVRFGNFLESGVRQVKSIFVFIFGPIKYKIVIPK